MLLSRSGEYALQALLHMADTPAGQYVLTREISQQHNLASHTLGKVLQTLVKSRLLDSQKGPGGGFKLAKPANEITLLEVIHVTEGPGFLQHGCVFGLPRCSDAHPCPVHHSWTRAKEELHDICANQTVAHLLDAARQGDADDATRLHLAFP